VYLVLAATMGTDTWTIRAKPVDGGVLASAALNTSYGNILPMSTAGGDVSVATAPTMIGNVDGTAIYDVFWSRMDYLLGRSDHWMTCKEADERVEAKIIWGTNEALCNSFNMKDRLPEELRHEELD